MKFNVPQLDKHKNADGTYNGISFMSEVTGIPRDELKWMTYRMLELLKSYSKDEAKAIVKEEAKNKPWLDK